MSRPKGVGFALQKISTEQFAVMEEAHQEGVEVSMTTSLRFGIDEKQRIIGVLPKVAFEQNEKTFIQLEIGCHFQIEESAWEGFLDPKTEKRNIPKGLLTHLVVLSVGTARGVLHAKTENTAFNKYLLPTINVTGMVKEDLVVEQ